jgi:hypothetical protein
MTHNIGHSDKNKKIKERERETTITKNTWMSFGGNKI